MYYYDGSGRPDSTKTHGIDAMIPVYKPRDDIELALVESLLQAHEIPYFVHNRGFGGLYPGAQIDFYNVRTVMVPDSAVDAARDALAELVGPDVEAAPVPQAPHVSVWDRIRLVAETFLGGWFVPRR